MEKGILIYKKHNREILFTLNKINFEMKGTKEKKYYKNYKIEDIKKLMKKDNSFTIELKNKKSYILISENDDDWYYYILNKIFNLNEIIKTTYLFDKNKQNKNVFCILNDKNFQCFNINDNKNFENNIEKILDINLNDIIDIYSTNNDEITCFTIESIESKKTKKYKFDAKTIEEKEIWIKEIGIATIKNKYSQYFNNNNNNNNNNYIFDFVDLVSEDN